MISYSCFPILFTSRLALPCDEGVILTKSIFLKQILDDFSGDEQAGAGGDEGNAARQLAFALRQLFRGDLGLDRLFQGIENL